MSNSRQRKTPRQRAEEALGVQQRKVKRLGEKVTAAEAELKTLREEQTAEAERLKYVESDPALTDRTLDEGDDDTNEEN